MTLHEEKKLLERCIKYLEEELDCSSVSQKTKDRVLKGVYKFVNENERKYIFLKTYCLLHKIDLPSRKLTKDYLVDFFKKKLSEY